MNHVAFQRVVSTWMASEAYRRLPTGSGQDEALEPEWRLPPSLRIVRATRKVGTSPSCSSSPVTEAAGTFSDPQAGRRRSLRGG